MSASSTPSSGSPLYLRGRPRLLALSIVFLLIGPTVILLYPLWLLGCASYDAYDQGILRSGPLLKLIGLSGLSVAAIHGVPWLIHRTGATWFYFGRAVPSMDIVAIATAFLLPALCLAIRNLPVAERHPLVRFTRKALRRHLPSLSHPLPALRPAGSDHPLFPQHASLEAFHPERSLPAQPVPSPVPATA